jgi:hypothetical protein
MSLNRFYDFILVLNSKRKQYTKNKYFSSAYSIY